MNSSEDIDNLGSKVKSLVQELSILHERFTHETVIEAQDENKKLKLQLSKLLNTIEILNHEKNVLTNRNCFETDKTEPHFNRISSNLKLDNKEATHNYIEIQKENARLKTQMYKLDEMQNDIKLLKYENEDLLNKKDIQIDENLNLKKTVSNLEFDKKQALNNNIELQKENEKIKAQLYKMRTNFDREEDLLKNISTMEHDKKQIVKNFQSKISDIENENKLLNDRLANLKFEKNDILEREINKKMQTIKDLELKITNLEKSLQREKALKIDMQNEIETSRNLKLNNKTSEEDKEIYRYRISEERKQMELERSRKEMYIGKFHDIKSEYEDYRSKSEKKIAGLEKENEYLNKEVDSLKDQSKSLQNKHNDVQKRLSIIRLDLDQKTLNTNSQIQSLKEDKQQLQSELSILKKEVNSFNNIKIELAVKSNQIKELENRITEMVNQKKSNEDEKKNAISELEYERRKRNQEKEDQNKCLKELDGMKWALKEQEKQISELERMNFILETDLNDIKKRSVEDLSRCTKEAVEDRSKLESVLKEKKRIECELESEIRKIKRLEESQNCIELELKETRKQLEDVLSSKLSLSEGREVLNNRLTKMERNLKDVKSDKEKLQKNQNLMERENLDLKEESTKLRTALAESRHIQLKMSEELHALEIDRDELREQINSYEIELAKARHTFQTTVDNEKLEKHKMEVTKRQQMNVIDLLQHQLNTPRKKRSKKTDKFFREEQLQKTLRLALDENARQAREKVELETKIRTLQWEKRVENGKFSPGRKPLENVENLTQLKIQQSKNKSATETPGAPKSPHFPVFDRPHQFKTGLNSRPDKCSLCLGNVEFVREATKCVECAIVCHPICAPKLPASCCQKTDYRRVYDELVNKCSDKKLKNVTELKVIKSGWIKIYNKVKNIWERKWMVLKDNIIYIYNSDDVIEPFCNDISLLDGLTLFKAAINPVELPSVILADLPLIFALRRSETIYINPGTVADKHHWAAYFDAINMSVLKSDKNMLSTVVIRNYQHYIHQGSCVNHNEILLATDKGLHLHTDSLDSTIDDFGSISAVEYIASLNLVVMIIDKEDRKVGLAYYKQILSIAETTRSSKHFNTIKLDRTNSCTTMKVGYINNYIYLAVATSQNLLVYKWKVNLQSFSIKKDCILPKPVSCMSFAGSNLIIGADKFYKISLTNFEIKELLNKADSSLAFAIYGTSKLLSYPLAVFSLENNEILVCYSDFGIFIDSNGNRSREDDLNWPDEQPLMISYSKPYLFLILSYGVQALHIPKVSNEPYDSSAVLLLPNPVFIGNMIEDGYVLVSSGNFGSTNLLSISADLEDSYDQPDGEEVQQRKLKLVKRLKASPRSFRSPAI